jgi:hypothetical protein
VTDQLGEARLEPFLILKNGGDLIHELQRQRFDIILHGHKHRPQFARVELRADDSDSYPLLVLAGGSTAKSDERPSDNTLRDIEVKPNGRLKIRTFEQGQLQERKGYQESLPILKRRAFARAVERTRISASEWYSRVTIDGVGHLRSFDRTSGLAVRHRDMVLPGIVSSVVLSPHDARLDVRIEEGSDVVSLWWCDDSNNCHRLEAPNLPAPGYYWLRFQDPIRSGSDPLNYATGEAAANSIAMSQWEVGERARHNGRVGDPDNGYEEVGSHISYPIEKLILRLEFPAELASITPKVRCRRHPAAPDFPLRYLPQERPRGPEPAFVPDADLALEEAKQLRYEADKRAWILEIDYPMPGYIYSLQWRVPDLIASKRVAERTLAWRKLLGGLLNGARPEAVIQQCRKRFNELAENLMERFHSSMDPDELQTAFLMLYDADKLCLRPALIHSRGKSLPNESYEVPLGGGVAGAAFLQRQIITWKNDPNSKSLIKPVSSGALNSRWVLALPIFHQQADASGLLKQDTRPSAVLGVITVGSDNDASKISDCEPNPEDPNDKTGEEIGQEAQGFAQECVFDIIDILASNPAQPGVP